MLSAEEFNKVVKEHLGLCIEGIDYPTKWTISQSPLGGRGLFAVEDISPGDVLFVDRPLIYGPRAGKTTQRGCTICCKNIDDNFFNCHKCALLLCSEECQNSDLHQNDCAIISRWDIKIPFEQIDDNLLFRALTPIRALMLDDNQKTFMYSLEAHVLPQHGLEVREIMEYFDIPEDDENVMVSACRALDANAFQIANPYDKEGMTMRGLYPVSGLMNHNCVANTRHSFNADNQMTVKAAKFIPAGSELFTCYTGLLWGTPARRMHLYRTKHFWCACARCADPTEGGTMLAALRCLSPACPGPLLPAQPLQPARPWRCLACGMLVPADHVGSIHRALGTLMSTLNFENAFELEKFLTFRITKYIPVTNQIVVDLQCRLIWILGETEGLRWKDITAAQLTLKESLCRGSLRALAALGAGGARLRGLLLYHLHAALAERARRDHSLFEELKSEIESTIEQAHAILDGDVTAPVDLALRRRYLGPGAPARLPGETFHLIEN